MIRSQNAVIDGGFVDTDSIQHIDTIKSDKELYHTFFACINELANTIEQFLIGSLGSGQKEYTNPTTIKSMIFLYLFSEISRVIEKQSQNGNDLPFSIKQLWDQTQSLEGFQKSLSSIFPKYKKFEADKLVT